MRTTFLNPTLWLLAGLAAAAGVGMIRGEAGRLSIEKVVRLACTWPVLAGLLLVAGIGLGSRAVLALRAPAGDGPERRAAVSRLLTRDPSPGSETHAAFAEWMFATRGSAPPWQPVPGVIECPADTMAGRVPVFTSQAHTPMLLLAEALVARFAGGHVMNGVLLLLSVAAFGAIALLLLNAAGLSWRSPRGVLLVSALAGWQPLLAGVRQADIALPAAALVVASWRLARRRRSAGSGSAAALAACCSPGALGAIPALARTAPRAALIATAVLIATVLATVAAIGLHVLPGFVLTTAYVARTYAIAPTNYSAIGRIVAANIGSAMVIAALTGAAALTWWRSRTIDEAFASWLALGLLAAPILWSQHLALLLVPAVVLLGRVWTAGSSGALAAWALLLILFSLPDPAVARLAAWTSMKLSVGAVAPVGAVALVILWVWTVIGAPAPRVERTPVAAAAG